MSQALNNVETTENYPGDLPTPEGTRLAGLFNTGPTAVAEIDVYNHAVYMQLFVSNTGDRGQASWQKELFMAPGHFRKERKTIFGIRFRSAVVAEAGRVTVELIGESECYFASLLLGGGINT